MITEENLAYIMPRSTQRSLWISELNKTMEQFKINTFRRQAAFLAQIATESAELTHLIENLNYRAERLMTVWPKRFTSLTFAQQYAGNPPKLANYVYADRNGNGNEASGDGYRYRGRGLIQLTGKANYNELSVKTGIDYLNNPDLLSQPEGACRSAAYFWSSHGLNLLADNDTEKTFVAITKIINGGLTAYQERKKYWLKAKQVIK